MSAAIRFGVLVGSVFLAPPAIACGNSADYDPQTLESKIQFYRDCGYWYVRGWEMSYSDLYFDWHYQQGGVKFTNDLGIPFLSGPWAYSVSRGRGIEHAEFTLNTASTLFGRDRVVHTTTAAWYLVVGRRDCTLADALFH